MFFITGVLVCLMIAVLSLNSVIVLSYTQWHILVLSTTITMIITWWNKSIIDKHNKKR